MLRNTQQSRAPIKVSFQITNPAQERKTYNRGLRPLLFSNSGVGSFTSQKNQISVSAVRRDLRFFVLIRED